MNFSLRPVSGTLRSSPQQIIELHIPSSIIDINVMISLGKRTVIAPGYRFQRDHFLASGLLKAGNLASSHSGTSIKRFEFLRAFSTHAIPITAFVIRQKYPN
jgi:hypothetical protein